MTLAEEREVVRKALGFSLESARWTRHLLDRLQAERPDDKELDLISRNHNVNINRLLELSKSIEPYIHKDAVVEDRKGGRAQTPEEISARAKAMKMRQLEKRKGAAHGRERTSKGNHQEVGM